MAQTEKLITLVKKYPLLYDTSHDDHRNIRKKDNIWDDIGKELNVDGDHLKKKWRNLRDTYGKYLRNIHTKSGQNAKRNYSNWQWAPLMETFRPYFAFADTVSNISVEASSHSEKEDLVELNLLQEEEPQEDEGLQIVDKMCSRKGNKKRKRQQEQLSASQETAPANTVLEYLKNKERAKSMDATDLIFLSYAQTLKEFSFKRQAEVKIKIATIMANEEFEDKTEKLLLSTHSSLYCSEGNRSEV